MNQIEIKLATVDERNWAAQLIVNSEPWSKNNYPLEKARQVCHDPAYQLYIASTEGQPVGAIIYDPRGLAGSPYIKWLVVDPAKRNTGIGTTLVKFAEDLAREHAKHLFLCVSSFNLRAQKLYQQLGFQRVGEIPDYFIVGSSEFLLHKRLT